MSSIYDELGVTPVLNAQGNRTLLGGNTVSAEVRALMDEAEEYYAHMGELTDRVSEKIADMLHQTKFEPCGPVEGHSRIKFCTSIPDFIGRHLLVEFCNQKELGHITQATG